MRHFFELLTHAAFVLTLFGCANVPQDLNPKTYYRHDMLVTVDGVNAEGVYVAPKKNSYRIAVTSQADMDMLQITSCQRDVTVENAIRSGWFKPRRSYIFDYVPTAVEKEPGCILKLAGLEKVNGRHSWAYIDFQDEKHTLQASLACNGAKEYRSEGVSICQSLQGLYQLIWFQAPVILSSKVLDRCKIPQSVDGGLHWKFKMQNRECVYTFMEMKPPYKRHRLMTIGYEDVPIRTGN